VTLTIELSDEIGVAEEAMQVTTDAPLGAGSSPFRTQIESDGGKAGK
jgi:hypothetical protein